MSTTLITGVSSGIGHAVTERLLRDNRKVLGISRTKPKQSVLDHSHFEFLSVDLSDLENLERQLPQLSDAHSNVSSIVLSAGYGRFGNLEEFSFRQIQDLINTNLTAQIMLTRAFLPRLKANHHQSDIVFIGSESVLSGGRRGAVYTAAKSGLHGFAASLRKECASTNVRVSLVVLGMVRSGFYDDAEFTHGEQIENYVEPDDVADAVSMILNLRKGTVAEQIVLTPQKSVIRRKHK